jgi:hypothetical protein
VAKDNFLILDGFDIGWHKRDDETRIVPGGARISSNITLTDRKGIAPRPGEVLLGTANSGSTGIKSLFSFHKTNNNTDILMKSYDDELEFYSNEGSAWARIMDGYTTGLVFGFKEGRIDATEFLDYVYFGNGVDKFSRWCGYDTLLNGALVGGEVSVTVDSTLLDDVYYTGTASGATDTVITIAASDWATNAWNNFYVYITDGAFAGRISLISGTTGTTVTFAAIAGLNGTTPAFQIRQIAVPATGTLVYGSNKVAYTAVPTATTFTVASASAAADNTILTVAPQTYSSAAPTGSIFETYYESLCVAGDPGRPITLFRSKTADMDDFSYSSPRAANEGDIAYFPYGGGDISDVKFWENSLVILKPHAVEKALWSQEMNPTGLGITDVFEQDTIKVGINCGTKARAWYVEDDLMWVTPDNRITTLGRVINKDTRPQAQDVAYDIRREVKDYSFDAAVGAEYVNRSFIGCRSDSDVTANDRTIVWNKDYKRWEGYWHISMAAIVPHRGSLYYGDAYSPDVYQMMVGTNRVKGDDTYPMSSRWVSGWINGRGKGFYLNEVSCLAVEGYIRLNTTINFKLYKDFSSTSFQDLQLVAYEDEDAIDGGSTFTLLGGSSLGLEPLGAGSLLGDEDDDGYRHFVAFLPFQITQVEYVSIEANSSGTNQGWEVTRMGINVTENIFEAQNRVI